MAQKYISREETAVMLTVSLAEVKRLVDTGKLRTVSRKMGPGRPTTLIKSSDVDDLVLVRKRMARNKQGERFIGVPLAERYSPEDAAKTYAALKQGMSPEDIVINLGIHPHAVMAIGEDWDKMRGAITLDGAMLTQLSRMGFDGVFPIESPEQLLEMLNEAAKARTCEQCEKRQATTCRMCMDKARARRAAETEGPYGGSTASSGSGAGSNGAGDPSANGQGD